MKCRQPGSRHLNTGQGFLRPMSICSYLCECSFDLAPMPLPLDSRIVRSESVEPGLRRRYARFVEHALAVAVLTRCEVRREVFTRRILEVLAYPVDRALSPLLELTRLVVPELTLESLRRCVLLLKTETVTHHAGD